MKISEHFVAQEFLPRATFNAIMKEEDPLKEFFKLVNPKIIAVAEFYRNFFGVPFKCLFLFKNATKADNL